jgi:hypothetical protein
MHLTRNSEGELVLDLAWEAFLVLSLGRVVGGSAAYMCTYYDRNRNSVNRGAFVAHVSKSD